MSAADAQALTTSALGAPGTASTATASSATTSAAQQLPVPPAGSTEWAAGPMFQAGLFELLGLGPAPVLPPLAQPGAVTLGLTEVTFLQDGADYFAAIARELDRVESASVGYVHLAFWEAWSLTRITDPYDGTVPDLVLHDRLLDVASWPDHTVRVILWAPEAPASWFAHNAEEALAFQTALDGAMSGSIAVRLEPFGAVHQSQHQKVAIFSGDGTVHAIVGGLNLSEWYWDDVFHDGTRTVGPQGINSCHDTALLLDGAATAAVEAEFLRRWMRVDVAVPPMAPTPPSTVTTGSVVDVKVTDGTRAKRDIQDALLQRIARAEDYVYLENYAIFDSALVDVLARRLRDVPDLSIVLNIPNPASFAPPNGYLHRLTWLELALQVCDSVEATIGAASQVLTKADAVSWDVVQPFGVGSIPHMDLDPWLEQSFLSCALPTAHHMVPFSNITAVTGPFRMYTPVRAVAPAAPGSPNTIQPVYIHSKLGLVDDDTAAVGSANFNYRSMLYDGEMTAFVVGDTDPRQIRNRLFDEWHMTDPFSWAAQAEANLAALQAGTAAVGQVSVVPLSLSDFPADVPDMSAELAAETAANLPTALDWLPAGARDLITAGIGAAGAPLVGLDSRTFH